MSKILVTGGTGFLGSNLCARLIDQGHNVTCLDNNYTGRISNVEKLLKNPNFKFIEHDVCDPINVNDKFEYIYNLA
ncbi:MAG: GDP-mannose 4,6-dehydratase, partial [Alphaproteobacteria bacterium]|nr:GDP-mannose 4,6-dehydratase [Alphaproteobacteria bacterium]